MLVDFNGESSRYVPLNIRIMEFGRKGFPRNRDGVVVAATQSQRL